VGSEGGWLAYFVSWPVDRVVCRPCCLLRRNTHNHGNQQGLQDDARYAQMYTRWRWRTSVRAPQQIGYELRMKGVGAQHVKEALELVFGSSGRMQQPEWSYGGGSSEEEEEEGEEDEEQSKQEGEC